MIGTLAAASALHLAIFLIAGLPAAFAVRDRREGWAALLADALPFGLTFATLAVTLLAWIGPLGVVLTGAVWIAFLVCAIVHRVGVPRLRRPTRADAPVLAIGAAVLALTVALRLQISEFLPWVGDMGAYVNWANEFVRTGEFRASWPPFFPSYLTISSATLGWQATTAGMPILGLVLVIVIARTAQRFGAGRIAILVVSVLAAISTHLVWYSSFPGSESLNAPLFLVWVASVLGVIRADRATLVPWAALSGLLMLSLGLLRGTAPLFLVPLLATAIVATVVAVWKPIARRVWLAFTVALAGALLSYWYGIVEIPRYYVETQVRDLVPGPLFSAIERLGLFSPSLVTALVLVALVGAFALVGWWVTRRPAPPVEPSRVPTVLGIVLGSAIAAGMLVDAIVNADVWQILLRSGIWLLIATIALIATIGRSRLSAEVQLIVLFAGTLAAVFLAIHTYRLKISRGHSFFLYWDRYLVSELIPLFFVVTALALTVLWRIWLSELVAKLRSSPSRPRRLAPVAIAALLSLGIVAWSVPGLKLATKDGYLAGAFAFQAELNRLVPTAATPVAWSATSEQQLAGWFFPNTWMAFAKPMQRSFGFDVVNIGDRGSDFAPDIVFTAESLTVEAVCRGDGALAVFETQAGGPSLDDRVTDARLDLTALGSATSDLALLSQPPTDGDWTRADIEVRAWLVEVDPAAAAAVSCPA